MSKIDIINNAVADISVSINNINDNNIQVIISSKDENMVPLARLTPGEFFSKNGTKYLVLENNDEHSGEVKVIMLDFYADGVIFDNNYPIYSQSSLKKFFDSEVEEFLCSNFGKENIVEHEVRPRTVDGQFLDEFICRTRPLTFDEVREYNNLLIRKELKGYYWTCSPWATTTSDSVWKYSVITVSPVGGVDCSNCFSNYGGVRPVCILKSNILVSLQED